MSAVAALSGGDPDQAAVLREFEDAGALLNGHFILSSGLRSPYYLQSALVLSEPKRAQRMAERLTARLADLGLGAHDFDLVVAPAMGGLIIGHEVARALDRPFMFAERVEGAFTLRRGFAIRPGQRYLMVEDVITTGKSSRECARCCDAAGGLWAASACLIDRSLGEHGFAVPVATLARVAIPTYKADELPDALRALPPVKPGSRGLRAASATR